MVPVAEVVAIVDSRLIDHAEVNREFIDRAMATKRIHGEELTTDCKALVVTRQAVFTSGISVSTLVRRMSHARRGMMAWEGEK